MKPDFEISLDVQMVLKQFIDCPVGDTLLYRDLTMLIGKDVTVYRYILASARRIALRDNNIVFQAVYEKGLRRLPDVEVVEHCSENRRKRTRNQSRYGAQELSTVNYDALPVEKKVQHNIGLAIFGQIIEGTTKKAVGKLTKAVNGGVPPVEGFFKLLGWK